nr:hypothetical protein CFP56_37110 [Quercus suber]
MDAVEAEVELSTALVRLVGVVPTTTPSDCTLRALPLTTKLTSLQLRAGNLVATADERSTEAARRKYFVVAIMIQCSSWMSTLWKLGRNGLLYLCAEDLRVLLQIDVIFCPCLAADSIVDIAHAGRVVPESLRMWQALIPPSMIMVDMV